MTTGHLRFMGSILTPVVVWQLAGRRMLQLRGAVMFILFLHIYMVHLCSVCVHALNTSIKKIYCVQTLILSLWPGGPRLSTSPCGRTRMTEPRDFWHPAIFFGWAVLLHACICEFIGMAWYHLWIIILQKVAKVSSSLIHAWELECKLKCVPTPRCRFHVRARCKTPVHKSWMFAAHFDGGVNYV